MNKITFLFIILLFAASANAQLQFPGRHPEILLEKEVTVKPLSASLQEFGYSDFHKKEEMKITDKAIKHSTLAGKNFKVTSVTPFEKLGRPRFKLKLESIENGTYYYVYDPGFDQHYKLEVVGGITLPEGIYCSDLETTTDKFTGEVTVKSPFTEGVKLLKSIKDGNTIIFMLVNEIGHTLNVGKTGFTLLLKDGTKIEKPEAKLDVEVNIGGKGYVYSAFVTLTTDDIAKLSKSPITDNRLFIYDGTIDNGDKIMEYIKCISKN